MRKFKLFLSMLMLMAFSLGNVWADSFTITLKDSGSGSDGSSAKTTIADLVAEGDEYLSSVTAEKAYQARSGRGVKFGTSSAAGSITFELKESVSATSIVVYARKYNDTEKSLFIQDKNDYEVSASTDFEGYTYTYETPAEISSISFGSAAKRIYVTSIIVNYTASTPKDPHTVSFNVGSGSTPQAPITETVGGAGITLPAGPAICEGWSFAGWAESSVATETSAAPTLFAAGSNYKPANDITLYAVYKRSEGTEFDGETEGDYYVYAEINETKYYATAFNKKPASTTDIASAVKYTFEKIVENEITYFAIKSNGKYLSYGTSGTDFTYNGTDPYKWQPTSGEHGSWRMLATTGSNRAIIYRAGTVNAFAPYATSNINGTEYFDIEIAGAAIYYHSTPACAPIVKHLVQVAVNDPDMGSATINGGASYEATEDDVLNLVATPNSGFQFVEWTYDDTKVILDDANAASTTAIASDAVTVTATFVACTDPEAVMTISKTEAVVGDQAHFSFTSKADIYDDAVVTRDGNPATLGVDYAVDLSVVESGRCEGDFTALKAGTFVISMHQDAQSGYCEADKEVTVVVNQPAATLTLSENGIPYDIEDTKLHDIISLPAPKVAAVGGKSFVGWSAVEVEETDIKPAYMEAGTNFELENIAQTLYAVYAAGEAGSESYQLVNLLTAGKTYIFATSNVAGDAFALPAKEMGNNTSGYNPDGVAISLTSIDEVTTIATTNTDLEFYLETIESENNDRLKLQVVEANTKYVMFNGNGIGLTENKTNAKVYWDPDNGLRGTNSAESTSYYLNFADGKFKKANSTDHRNYAYEKHVIESTYNAYSTSVDVTAKYIVSIATPENGTLVVKNADAIVENGAELTNGTVLTLIATPNTDYRNPVITINGDVYEEATYTINGEDIAIAASFAEKADPNLHWSLSEVSVALDAMDGFVHLSYPKENFAKAEVSFSSTNPDAVEIHNGDKLHGDIARWATGEATLTASFPGNEYYKAAETTCHITVTAPEWNEILFPEIVSEAGVLNGQTIKADGSEFGVNITDTRDPAKTITEALSAKFGTLEASKQYYHRLKPGGWSNNNNFMTLYIPDNGMLRLAVRSADSEATDRNLVLTQNDVEIYNEIVKEADAIIDPENESKKAYPYINVPVKEGTVDVTYPVGGLNFYAMGFKMNPKHTVTIDAPANGTLQVLKGEELVESGAQLTEGTVLTLVATPAAGYQNPAITINGDAYESTTYVIGNADVEIAASFEEIPEPAAKFYIIGNAEVLGAWTPANAIKSTEDSYILHLAAGNYEMKVILDNTDWDHAQAQGYSALTEVAAGLTQGTGISNDNILFELTEEGNVTVTYIAGETFKLEGNFYVEPIPMHTYTVVGVEALVGHFWGEGLNAPENEMIEKDGIYQLVKENLELAVSNYEYQVAKDHDWRGVENSVLEITVAGIYNVTFTFDPANGGATNAIPELVKEEELDPTAVLGIGAWDNNDDWSQYNLILSSDKKSASFTVENLAAGDYRFKMIINGGWRSNGHIYHRDYASASGIENNDDANMKLTVDKAGDYTFTWTFETNAIEITFPELILANGYYLISEPWNVESISAVQQFEPNPENPGEYALTTTLTLNQGIKVVEVYGDVIVNWYPGGEDNQYIVNKYHTGETDIYFRPEGYVPGWYEGYFFVKATSEETAIDNAADEKNAVKVLRNDVIYIIKGGKTYNITGQRVK